MRLTYLGKDANSQVDDCPALYRTDRGTYVVQGWTLTDPDAHADLHQLAPGETVVEVPESVLDHYIRERATH